MINHIIRLVLSNIHRYKTIITQTKNNKINHYLCNNSSTLVYKRLDEIKETINYILKTYD